MKQYQCLIVDDESLASEIILHFCSQLPFINVLGVFDNALEAKTFLSNNNNIDILFLDIQMPVLDGLSFLKILKHPPQVIFTTAYKDYAVEAFDLTACDYLLKPFSFERFILAVDKAVEKLTAVVKDTDSKQIVSEDYFFIKAEGKIFKITYEEMLFAEAMGNYTKVVMSNTSYLSAISFSNFEKLLPSLLFVRVHRSYIINKSKIESIEGNTIRINKVEIPMGNNYRDRFMKGLGL